MKTVHNTVDPNELRRRSAFLLGAAGMLPFWPALFAQFLEPGMGEEAVRAVERVVLLYGLSIVSFMGGGRWVLRLMDPDTKPGSMFGGLVGAVGPALLAWFVAFLPDSVEGQEFTPLQRLLVIALILWFQFVQDWSHRAFIRGQGMPWYLGLRLVLTVGATTPLILGAFVAPLF